jgi:hypothetical protein
VAWTTILSTAAAIVMLSNRFVYTSGTRGELSIAVE